MGMDWGLDHPAANLWIRVDTDQKLIYVSNEFVKSGLSIEEIAEAVKALSGTEVPEYAVLDPSANKRDPGTKKSITDEYRRCFRVFGGQWEYFSIKTGDRRDRGYEIVKRYLKKGMIKVHPRCKNLIYGLENVMVGDKTGDDATDALRYACVNIHDAISGMNVLTDSFESMGQLDAEGNKVKVFNFNDPLLFPEINEKSNDPIMDMIYATV